MKRAGRREFRTEGKPGQSCRAWHSWRQEGRGLGQGGPGCGCECEVSRPAGGKSWRPGLPGSDMWVTFGKDYLRQRDSYTSRISPESPLRPPVRMFLPQWRLSSHLLMVSRLQYYPLKYVLHPTAAVNCANSPVTLLTCLLAAHAQMIPAPPMLFPPPTVLLPF